MYSNIKDQLIFVDIHIKSFSKINLNKNWIKDINKLVQLHNIKYLSSELIEFRQELNNVILLLHNILNYDQYDNLVNYWLYYKQIKKLKLFIDKISFLLNLKPYLLDNLKVNRLPTKKLKISTLKSPHVFKKAQDHYEYQHHKLVLKLPLLYKEGEFIAQLLLKTTKLESLQRITFRRKNIYLIKKSEK